MQRGHRVSVRTIAIGSTIVALGAILGPLHVITLNASPSMPLGLYVRSFQPIHIGSIVSVCPPLAARRFLADRDNTTETLSFTPWCPDGATPFLKSVAALPGDSIVVQRDGVHVNGHPALPGSRPLVYVLRKNTREKIRLPSLTSAHIHIPQGDIWAYSPTWNSFDSRYYGPVVPLVTLAPLMLLPWEHALSPPRAIAALQPDLQQDTSSCASSCAKSDPKPKTSPKHS
jgi:conjugative transfer signal peptidase TraF